MENTNFSNEVITAFETFNAEKIDKLSSIIYAIANNALKEYDKNAVTAIKEIYTNLKSSRERLYNLLLINQKSELLFLLGEITASLGLTYGIIKNKEAVDRSVLWLDNSPLSFKIVKTIKEKNFVSTPDLSVLCEVSSGSVAQAMRKIKENNLVGFHTIGRTNYYHLTPLGEKVLTEKIRKDKESSVYMLSLIGESEGF